MNMLILVTAFIAPLLCVLDADYCNILDTTYIFLEALIKQHVETKYQDFACLEYFFYRNNSNCVFKNAFNPIDTEPCRNLRKEIDRLSANDFTNGFDRPLEITSATQMSFIELENYLFINDVDSDVICDKLRIFNDIPLSKRTKEMYAGAYNLFGKYAVYGSAENIRRWCTNFAKNLLQCILDANAEALSYLGNLTSPVWPNNKCGAYENTIDNVASLLMLKYVSASREKPGVIMSGSPKIYGY